MVKGSRRRSELRQERTLSRQVFREGHPGRFDPAHPRDLPIASAGS